MKILLFPFEWYGAGSVSGGLTYLYRLSQYLISQGHEVKCACHTDVEYEHDNIKCYPIPKMQMWQNGNNDLVRWCDLIITHLNGSSMAYNKSNQHNKPLCFIAHNTVKSYVIKYSKRCHILYNSEWVKSQVNPTFDKPNMVLNPPIDYRKFSRNVNGKYITLVNCAEMKGGNLFVELARALPQYEFLGVKGGYAEQVTGDLPNLTYIDNGADMNEVYSNTAILLQPSAFETFGQAVLEAMCCGIPIIAHHTDGLKECIGTGGQFADRNNIADYVDKIVNLMNDPKEWSDKAYNRAVELDPLPKLSVVNEWLEKIVKEHKNGDAR